MQPHDRALPPGAPPRCDAFVRSRQPAIRSLRSGAYSSCRRDRDVGKPPEPVRARRERDGRPFTPIVTSVRVRHRKGSVALQGLDAGPLAPRGNPRAQVSSWLDATRPGPPRLLQHGPSAIDLLAQALPFGGDRRLRSGDALPELFAYLGPRARAPVGSQAASRRLSGIAPSRRKKCRGPSAQDLSSPPDRAPLIVRMTSSFRSMVT